MLVFDVNSAKPCFVIPNLANCQSEIVVNSSPFKLIGLSDDKKFVYLIK